MSIDIQIDVEIDEAFADNVAAGTLVDAVTATLTTFIPAISAERQTADLTLVITNSAHVQQLNHTYRGIDTPTDVLSFENLPDPDFPDPTFDTTYLGDVIIAYPVASRQAAQAGHTPQDELTLLAIHGTLHLLGYDHDTPARKAEMWQAQQQVLARLGLAHIQPTEQ